MRTPGGESCGSSTSGVLPIRSSSELRPRRPSAIPARHGGQEDDRRALAHGCVQAAARPHVLAVDVDVHVRADLARRRRSRAPSAGSRVAQVLEQLAHRRARGLDLARAACLLTQDGRDAYDAHRVQNST